MVTFYKRAINDCSFFIISWIGIVYPPIALQNMVEEPS